MKRKPHKLTTVDEAKPCKTQHKKPCHDCPFARTALQGWLGGQTPEEYLQLAHSEARIDCHTKQGPQCAGAAIYRKNILKKPRDPEVLLLPADKEAVFANPIEFLNHHKRDSDEATDTP